MFLFDIGQEVSIHKVLYEVKALFQADDTNYYTLEMIGTKQFFNFEERDLFKSKNDYDKAKMSKQIALLEAHVTQLQNDLSYYKNAYYSIFNNRHRW